VCPTTPSHRPSHRPPLPPSPPARPVLSPAARRLWRDGDTLQLGGPSGRAVVLEGAGALKPLLPLLDGTRTCAQVVLESGDARTGEVLELLRAAGLLLDADDLHPTGLDRAERDRLAPDVATLSLLHGRGAGSALLSRRAARVVVHGARRVGAPLAALLSAAGVGTVDVRDDQPARLSDTSVGGLTPLDLGRPRAQALAGRLRSVGSARPPALVVLTDDSAAQTAAVLVPARTPHLLARVDEHVGTVGPLVLPGRSACLRCLDLTRSLLDPGWPAMAAQLEQPRRGTPPCDGVLAVAVASQAALQVLELLEGGTPASVSGTLELEIPGWRWRRRSWPQHPGCPCAGADQPTTAIRAA
jgi:bacteriocin biosynthesis cyclodehydratase domain-containing protein